MELVVSNPVHEQHVVAGTTALRRRSGVGVLLDVESDDEQREPPFVRPSASCRFMHSPLVRLLVGYALVLALAVPVSVLNATFAAVVNVARGVRGGEARAVLKELLFWLPVKVAFWLPFALFFVVQADWSFVLVVGDIYFPWLVPLLYALPVWRSPTAKLRTFAGAGDFAATRRLLGGGNGAHAARGARGRLGTQLRRAVDFRRGGKADDRAQLEVVKRLLAAGADPDITDGEGQSALHQMVQVGHCVTARALLEAGADPNLRDESGKAALHYAVGDVGGYRPQPAAVSLLLEDSWSTDPSLVRDSGNWRCYSLYGQVQTAFMAARGQDARSLLMPKPGWDAVAAALNANIGGGAAAAALLALLPSKRRGLRALQLLDLLWDRALEPDAVARVARRRLIFDRLIAPLVRDAPARKLERGEKALLIHACKVRRRHRLSAAPADLPRAAAARRHRCRACGFPCVCLSACLPV
jgi:hypothetical protein